jgi:membrane-associated protein
MRGVEPGRGASAAHLLPRSPYGCNPEKNGPRLHETARREGGRDALAARPPEGGANVDNRVKLRYSPVVDLLREFFSRLRDLESLLTWGGYPVLMAIIFSETGLLIGFFLPGDSLLVTAGVLVNANQINPLALPTFTNLLLMNVVLSVTAIIGDAVGYSMGYKAGPRLFNREQSFFFRRDYLIATQKFYETHGGKTIVLARFMPFARTFAPIVAGIGQMSYRRFLMFNVCGGIGWVFSMTFLGYYLGQVLGAKDIEKVVYLIIVVSVLPPAIAACGLTSRRAKARYPRTRQARASQRLTKRSSPQPRLRRTRRRTPRVKVDASSTPSTCATPR